MKKLEIEKIEIENFKGLKLETISFNENFTDIYGANGTGKTSIIDAFFWCLFNQDSHGTTMFEIKPLKQNGKKQMNIETRVTVFIKYQGPESYDWQNIELKKVRKEKWKKVRGSVEKVFDGYTSEYFINSAPYTETEYKEYINNIVSIEIFKTLSSPREFPLLEWKKQRDILMELANVADNLELISRDEKFEPLRQEIQIKTLDDYKAQLTYQKKEIKSEANTIPARIDEQKRYLLSDDIDILKLRETYNKSNDELKKLLENAKEVNNDSEIKSLKLELNEIDYKMAKEINDHNNLESERKSEYYKNLDEKTKKTETEINEIKNEIESQFKKLTYLVGKINKDEQEINILREKSINEQNKKFEFSQAEFCESCGRAFEKNELEKAKKDAEEAFNLNKANKIEYVKSEGLSLRAEIDKEKLEHDELEKQMRKNEEKKNELENKLADIRTNAEPFKETIFVENASLKNRRAEIIKSIDKITNDSQDHNESLEQKIEIKKKEVEDISTSLKQHDSAEKRINELLAEEQKVNERLTAIEAKLSLLLEFIKYRVDITEEKINSMFLITTFKMFNTTLEGNIIETCTAMVDGVPYSDLNNASKINCGIDIINVLNDYYEINAPIFVDNKESVTNLIETKNQLINLIVSEKDEQLRIGETI